VTTSVDPSRASRRNLITLLVLALILRLGWGLSRPTDPASLEVLPDQREYLQIANHLLHGEGFHFFDPRFYGEVYAFRAPGYPVFVALCGASPRTTRIAQALIDTATVLAVFLIARRWLAEGPSLLAAAVVAFNPFLIYFSGLLLSETLFTALATWGALCLLGNSPHPKDSLWQGLPVHADDPMAPARAYSFCNPLVGAALLALAILVRPSGIALPVLLGITAALLNRHRHGAYPNWWPLPPATTLLLFTLAALAPWGYRNHRLLGHWVWTTTNGGITAYDGFNDDATGASDQRFASRISGLSETTELQRDAFFSDEAQRWIRHHPRRAMELTVNKIARTWSPIPLSAEYGKPFYRWIGGLYAVPFDLLILLGVFYGPLPRSVKVYLLIPAIYLTAVHAMTVGSLRYRLPAEPLLAIVAASSCAAMFLPNHSFRRVA
jgi:4-amino-4-deoxy-L-arabinose transferase-like glycosyltransferase